MLGIMRRKNESFLTYLENIPNDMTVEELVPWEHQYLLSAGITLVN